MAKFSLICFPLLILLGCVQKKEKPTPKYVLQDYNLRRVPINDTVDWRIWERNLFDEFRNELIIDLLQDHSSLTKVSYVRRLEIIFKDWKAIELDKDYEIEDLKSKCEYDDGAGKWKLRPPTGNIRLISKTPDSLTFLFNLSCYEKQRNNLWIYRGERIFKKDNNFELRRTLLQQHALTKIERRTK